MAFGIAKLYQNLPQKYINFQNSFIFIAIIFIIFTAMLKSMLESRKKVLCQDLNRRQKNYLTTIIRLKTKLKNMSRGRKCGKCQGDQCIVGYTKTLINTALEEGVLPKQKVFVHSKENIDKPFEKIKL